MTAGQLLWLGGAIVLLAPSVIFVGTALVKGMSLADTMAALLQQLSAERVNLAVASLLGLFPLLLLACALWLAERLRTPPAALTMYAIGGLVPIGVVMLMMNLQYWPVFLPGRTYLGFPHGLEFIIGPGVFAPAGILFGFVFVWLLRRTLR